LTDAVKAIGAEKSIQVMDIVELSAMAL